MDVQPMLNTVQSFVKEQRESLNITQDDLAKLADVSLRSITTIEKGEWVSLGTIKKVLEVFGAKARLDMEIIK